MRLALPGITIALALAILPALGSWWLVPDAVSLLTAGGVSWLIGVAVKFGVYGLMATTIPLTRPAAYSALSGLVSAATELGAAVALYPASATIGLPELLTYGAGAGCTEIAVLVGWSAFQAAPAATQAGWMDAARGSWCVRLTMGIERAVALAGHVGSRGLVVLAVFNGPWWVAGIAVLAFAAVDGAATYGVLRRWDWNDPSVSCRYFGAAGLIGVGEVGLLVLLAADYGSR